VQERAGGGTVPMYVWTEAVAERRVQAALAELSGLPELAAPPTRIRVLPGDA
jgi:hypothetical protein